MIRWIPVAALLALGACGQDPADEAFRALVGKWQLDSTASLEATLDGNLFAGFLPRDELVAALSEGKQRAPLVLRIDALGAASLEDPSAGRPVVTGRVEDAGSTFFIHFRFGDGTDSEKPTRVTLELRRLDQSLHAWVVGAEGKGAEAAHQMFQAVGLPISVHLVFKPSAQPTE
jgi:hypothetical protein